jgi:hypothetical protein
MKQRTRLAAAFALCALTLLLAAPAGAQSGGSLITFGPGSGGRLLSYTSASVHIGGQFAVSFSGSTAAGCASVGVCGYSGTIVWRPAPNDELDVLKFRRNGKITYQASLVSTGENGILPETDARVTRGSGPSAAVCSDAQSSYENSLSTAVRGSSLVIRLVSAQGSLLSTRCAGPRDSDLSGAPGLTGLELKLAALANGHAHGDLRGVTLFRAHGFAGAVRSTVVLSFGKPRNQLSGAVPKSLHRRRIRTVVEHLQLVSATGGEQVSVAGSSDPAVCRQLDSCGLSGTMSWTPVPTAVDAYLETSAPATRSYHQLLAVLHGKPGPIKHPFIIGQISWSDRGKLQASTMQAGATCTDAAPLGGAAIVLITGSGLTTAAYTPSGSLRTRCPGPELDRTGAVGTFRLALLTKPTFTLPLAPTPSFTDDGYSVRLSGGVSLKLRRGRVQQFIETGP